MAEPTAPPVLPPDASARLAEFARACKAAARAASLYPAAHPAIGTTLGRLSQVTSMRVRVLFDSGGRRLDPPFERSLWEPAGDEPDSVVSPADPADYAIDPLNFLPA
jgi:hypothetical protein